MHEISDKIVMRNYDVGLRIALEDTQETLDSVGTPDEWKWDNILHQQLGSFGQVSVQNYVRHETTVELDEDGNLTQTTVSELINSAPIVETDDDYTVSLEDAVGIVMSLATENVLTEDQAQGGMEDVRELQLASIELVGDFLEAVITEDW